MVEPTHTIAVDLARVYDRSGKGRKLLTTLAWGDSVCVTRIEPDRVEVELELLGQKDNGGVCLHPQAGIILASPSKALAPIESNRVLKVDFVDVHCGDGAVIETPRGKLMLVDGGGNELFARFLATRFPGTTPRRGGWKEVDCILVTHGDARHFHGLTKIRDSEKEKEARKRLFIHPRRVFHNGIVRREGHQFGEARTLGETVERGGRLYLSGLESDLLKLRPDSLDPPFRRWREALTWYRKRGPVVCDRLRRGDGGRFAFLSDGEPSPFGVSVLGPVVVRIRGMEALPMLKPARLNGASSNGFYSASRTIDGHAVLLRLTYGRFSVLLAGDMNHDAERALLRDHQDGRIDLASDVFKAPHHDAAEISPGFLRAVAPAVSVVSSCDRLGGKDYTPPRASLLGALGRYSRLAEPLIFVTPSVPSLETVGYVSPKEAEVRQRERPPSRFYAFRRAPFATVMVRTDGERLLVAASSGHDLLREAHAFTKSASGRVVRQPLDEV
jgi:beta-lactamase superfamily II metal-dependent hydrolase